VTFFVTLDEFGYLYQLRYNVRVTIQLSDHSVFNFPIHSRISNQAKPAVT